MSLYCYLMHEIFIQIVATRCQILGLKCTKFDFLWGYGANVKNLAQN